MVGTTGALYVQYVLPWVGRDRIEGGGGLSVTVLNHSGENI